MAITSLCLLAQAYQHASSVIQYLTDEDINVRFLVQLDKLIHLLETPIFAYIRLQLLELGKYIWLLKALYGLFTLFSSKVMHLRFKDSFEDNSFIFLHQVGFGFGYQDRGSETGQTANPTGNPRNKTQRGRG